MSAGSQVSAVREATMRRIQDLEAELNSARREREVMESNVSLLKATLGHNAEANSPNGPLSPRRF